MAHYDAFGVAPVRIRSPQRRGGGCFPRTLLSPAPMQKRLSVDSSCGQRSSAHSESPLGITSAPRGPCRVGVIFQLRQRRNQGGSRGQGSIADRWPGREESPACLLGSPRDSVNNSPRTQQMVVLTAVVCTETVLSPGQSTWGRSGWVPGTAPRVHSAHLFPQNKM